MHKSVFHTHHDRICKSPTALKRENKLQDHSILLIDSYRKGWFTEGNPQLYIKTVTINTTLVSTGWCCFASLCN